MLGTSSSWVDGNPQSHRFVHIVFYAWYFEQENPVNIIITMSPSVHCSKSGKKLMTLHLLINKSKPSAYVFDSYE